MALTTYSPKLVSVNWNGILLSGFADGKFVECKRRSDTYTLKVGADGFSARSQLSDRSGEITISLLQTSPSNDLLAAAAVTDELSQATYGAMLIKDLSGRTVVAAANAWIKKVTDVDFEKEVVARDWVFETDLLEMFPAGN